LTTYADGRLTTNLATDLIARALVIVLFSLACYNLFGEFLRTGHVTGLLLLASEALVVVLTLIRRRPKVVDRSTAGVLATSMSLAGPPLLRAIEGANAVIPDGATAAVSAVGLGLSIVGKVAIGRSFGIAPANRGIVARGPYLFMRHPIYAGYLITHLAFFVAHPSPWNAAVIILADGALVMRALIEERVLSADAQYQTYCHRVQWHLVPGVF
jgi:protein-S-isoprenylcysteine O-methyltransferase Ste14